MKRTEPTDEQIREAVERADYGCDGIVTRNFEQDACYKDVVCLVFYFDSITSEVRIWGACAYHANRYGGKNIIPLLDSIKTMTAEIVRLGDQVAMLKREAETMTLNTFTIGDSTRAAHAAHAAGVAEGVAKVGAELPEQIAKAIETEAYRRARARSQTDWNIGCDFGLMYAAGISRATFNGFEGDAS